VGGGAALGNGFGDGDNSAVGAMAVFNGRLFVSVGGDTGPTCELWWTDDGTTWTRHTPDGFGDADNQGVLAMAVFDGYLYAGTINRSGSGSQVYRTNDGEVWTAANLIGFLNANNRAVTSMTVHDGQLFAGTENVVNGGQIYRSTNGTTWIPVIVDGFGLPANRAVASLQSYGGRLYAGTYRASTLFNQPAELWWTENLTDWTSAAAAGFGDNYNMAFPAMAVHDGYLFVGTSQLNFLQGKGCEVWRLDGTNLPQMVNTNGFGAGTASTSAVRFFNYNGELLLGIDHTGGGKIMRYVDLLDWDTLVAGGFGNSSNLLIADGAVLNSNLFVGTANSTQGCEVYREVSTLLVDSFESGDTTAWSSTVP